MAMVTTPIISPPTSSSLHRKGRSTPSFSPSSSSSAGRPLHQQQHGYGGTIIATPATTPPPPSSPQKQHRHTSCIGVTRTKGDESPRFRLSKLLAPLQTHQLHHARSEQDQQQFQSPLSPQQQHQHQQQAPHQQSNRQHQYQQHNSHGHGHRLFSSKHANPATRFRRGGFFGFLQSHYHAFHRSQDQQQQHAGGVGANGNSNSNGVGNRKEAAAAFEKEQRRRRAIAAVSPRTPEGSPFMTNMYSGSSSSNNSNKSPHTTVHSGYNMTISDFRAHATISSTCSANLPTKVTDVVFDQRRSSSKNQDTHPSPPLHPLVATPPTTPPPFGNNTMDPYCTTTTSTKPNFSSAISTSLASSQQQQSVLGGGGFRASLRSMGILGPVTSQTTATQQLPKTPTSPPLSPTISATAPVHPKAVADAVSSSPQQKQRRKSIGQGLGRDKESNRDSCSPTGSPSTSKLASKGGWASKMTFLNLKRKPSLPLQSHYLSLPVGGTAATSPTGMYMLHSEDLSVTEFAKLAGITILQEDDDPTTFEESQVNVGDEVHVHRRGSSAELSVAAAAATAGEGCGLECAAAEMLGGSAGNTVNSDRNLTVGSNGSDRGGSRKTNIWDPQFWADPVSDGATSKWLLPSTSTSSLPITCGSGLLAPRTGSVLVGSSAPNSPKLKPRSSLPTSGLSSGALPSAPTCIQTTTGVARLGPTTTTTVTTTNGVPTQRRRNSCAPAVLMPAAGSRSGSEIDRARHYTSSGVSLKKVDQLPRPPMDAIQLPQDLGRRRSFSSLTAVALELEGGDSGEAGSVGVLERGIGAQDSVQVGHVLGDLVTATTTTPYLNLEPSTPTTPTKATQFIIPAPSMSHTLAMQALHTPRSRGSVSGGHSPRSGVSRTRSPSPSPLSRQIDMGSLESPQEEKSGFFEGKDARMAYLSPPSAPPASRNSRHSFSHGNSGSERANMHLSTNVLSAPMPHHSRAQTLPPSLSDQQMNHTQRPISRTPPRPPSTSTSSTSINPPVMPSPPRSITPSPTSLSTPPSPGRKFAPGTKVGRFTLVQERCTKHVDLLKEQQAQRRASLGELTLTRGSGNRGDYLASTPSSSSSSSLLAREDSAAVLDTIENPMLKPDDNVRVFQRKRSRRILNPNELLPPPPVSY